MKLDTSHPVRKLVDSNFELRGPVTVNKAVIQGLPMPADLQGMSSVLPEGRIRQHLEAYVPYFIAMNTMNYQFWDVQSDGEFVRYEQHGAVGALAMQQAFHGLWQSCMSTVSPDFYNHGELAKAVAAEVLSHFKCHGVASIFGDIPEAGPDKPTRMEILEEVLNPERLAMVSAYLTSRVTLDNELGWAEAQVLATVFPKAYHDPYLKKAQLTLMFIAAEWNAAATAANPSASRLKLNVTAAADYQLPKVLRTLGILTYSPELADKVDGGQLIEAGSMEEQSIRDATIEACDLLAQHFNCSIEEVDFWLWVNRNVDRTAKFHRTKTTDY